MALARADPRLRHVPIIVCTADQTAVRDRAEELRRSGGLYVLQKPFETGQRLQAIVADRGYKGLATLAAKRQLKLDIKAKPPGTKGFTPIGPLWRVEHAFAQLGRWRRLARCYEGSEASAKAWLEVASMGYLFGRV